MIRLLFFSLFTIWLLVACEKTFPPLPDDAELLDGPVEGLSEAENRRFLAGDVAFNDEVFTATTGLGPLFVSTSCGSCHAGDGKGHPMNALTRFGQCHHSRRPEAHVARAAVHLETKQPRLCD